MKTVSMPDLWARAAIALGLPPLDLPAYQIHMPSPSKGLGVGTNWGAAIGGEIGSGVGLGGVAMASSATRARAKRRVTVTVSTTNRAKRRSLRLNGSAVVLPPAKPGGR